MGEWQQGELSDNDDIVYLIGLWENLDGQVPVPSDLDRWQDQVGFTGTAMLLDYGQTVFDLYAQANPGPSYTNAVTVIIDKQGVIADVKGTYETDDAGTLALLQDLSAQ